VLFGDCTFRKNLVDIDSRIPSTQDCFNDLSTAFYVRYMYPRPVCAIGSESAVNRQFEYTHTRVTSAVSNNTAAYFKHNSCLVPAATCVNGPWRRLYNISTKSREQIRISCRDGEIKDIRLRSADLHVMNDPIADHMNDAGLDVT